MTAAPRLVATDLDGTLVRDDQTVSARTRAAVQAVRDAGAVFVMVTGRPPRWMPPVAEQVGEVGLALCANGALVLDVASGEVVQESLIGSALALDVVARLRASVPGIAFAVEQGLRGFGREEAYLPRYDNGQVRVAPLEELTAGGLVKLLARVEGADSDELLAAARDVLGDDVECTHSSSDGLLEISARGVSKASALARLAAAEGISADQAVAFGDMPNDLPMLAWAGLSVAMSNAHPAVLAAADEVTLSNDEDGVAVVLERWF